MKPNTKLIFFLLAIVTCLSAATVVAQEKETATKAIQLFDGKTLDGWDGDPKFWSVEDGAITGRTTKELSLIHISSPRDRQKSRMPSSA